MRRKARKSKHIYAFSDWGFRFVNTDVSKENSLSGLKQWFLTCVLWVPKRPTDGFPGVILRGKSWGVGPSKIE